MTPNGGERGTVTLKSLKKKGGESGRRTSRRQRNRKEVNFFPSRAEQQGAGGGKEKPDCLILERVIRQDGGKLARGKETSQEGESFVFILRQDNAVGEASSLQRP